MILGISQDCMRKIIGKKPTYNNESHDLTIRELITLPYHINNPVLVIQANDAVSRRLFIEISRYQRKVCSIIDLRGNHIEFNGEFDIYPMKKHTFQNDKIHISACDAIRIHRQSIYV